MNDGIVSPEAVEEVQPIELKPDTLDDVIRPVDSGSHAADVQLAIEQVILLSPGEATVTVRCLLGPVRLGARFDRIRGSAEAIDLELLPPKLDARVDSLAQTA